MDYDGDVCVWRGVVVRVIDVDDVGVMLRCNFEWMALLSVVHCIHMIVCGVVRACSDGVGSRLRCRGCC